MPEEDSNIIFCIFDTFSSELTNRVKVNRVSQMIEMGKSINPVYLKFRLHYGKQLYKLKDEYMVQF